MILHNSIRVAQNLSRRNSHAQIKLGDMPSLNNRVRLTYGHRNPLNNFNYRETRELASNKHEQYSGSPEHQHCLGSEVPTNNVESCNGSAFLLYEGNQQRTVLYRNPDLAYERVVPQSHEVNRVVTHSYQVNRVAKRYAESKTSLRGAVQCVETYEIFVGHSITESNPVQPFGSMPCRRNSARASSFNQLPRLTPSRSAASLSCCRNSGVIRIWKVGDSPSPFGVLSRLIVDMYVRNLIAWILLCTYVITTNMQKTTPRTAGTVPGRLTSTDKLRIEEAMKDHITHPQGRNNYIWRFLALNRHDKKATPCRLSVEAATERDARRILAPHFILSLAARLPVSEVRHA